MEVPCGYNNVLASREDYEFWLESKLNNFLHVVAIKTLPKYRYFGQEIDFVKYWADHYDIPLNDADFSEWMVSILRIIRREREISKSTTSPRRPISGRKMYKLTKFDMHGSLSFLLDCDVRGLSRHQLRKLFHEVLKTLILKFNNEIEVGKAVSPLRKTYLTYGVFEKKRRCKIPHHNSTGLKDLETKEGVDEFIIPTHYYDVVPIEFSAKVSKA